MLDDLFGLKKFNTLDANILLLLLLFLFSDGHVEQENWKWTMHVLVYDLFFVATATEVALKNQKQWKENKWQPFRHNSFNYHKKSISLYALLNYFQKK